MSYPYGYEPGSWPHHDPYYYGGSSNGGRYVAVYGMSFMCQFSISIFLGSLGQVVVEGDRPQSVEVVVTMIR